MRAGSRYRSRALALGIVLAGALVAGACETASSSDDGSGGEDRAQPRARAVGVYAAVIRQLVTVDHTFGERETPIEHVYVVDAPVDGTGDPYAGEGSPGEPFGTDVEEGLRDELVDLPPLEFIADPDSVRLGEHGMDGVENNGVIITLGPIAGDGDEVEVGSTLWCGGLCGLWLTYVVELEQDGVWEQGGIWMVTGTTGDTAIA